MKKLLSIILALTLILPCISAFVLEASAEDKYAELWKQREEYLKAKYEGYAEYLEKADSQEKIESPINYGGPFPYFSACELTILLYTNIAKDLTLEMHRQDPNVEAYLGRWRTVYYTLFDAKERDIYTDFWVISPEISKAIEDCIPRSEEESTVSFVEMRSALRACIKFFDIPKEDLIKANKLMQEDPDILRDILPPMSDAEFERARWESGLFCAAPLEDFMIEALYLEDDVIANNLLCEPYAVFVKEYDSIVILNGTRYIDRFFDSDIEYDKFDLTPEYMGDFINVCYHADNWLLSKDIGIKLRTEREKQLANPKPPSTGEEVYLIPVALVSLALGALVIYPRRRKIDNI